ncbi:unnamed protein product [Gordionus sp. m RMFG-2023]|uniref:annexin-B12-like n=1 Tax=Gordionus sp. m RMFG-2023 TaxID=3053472 RepID=UPI0030E44452
MDLDEGPDVEEIDDGDLAVDSKLGSFVTAGKPFQGTIKDFTPFNAKEDAKKLRKAIKGLGTDDKTVINILTKRSQRQRQEIAEAYKTLFGKNLEKSIKGDFSGTTKKALVALLYPREVYSAILLHRALRRVGTNLGGVAEVLCTLTPEELEMVKKAYQKRYKKDLYKTISRDTSGDVKLLLLEYIKGNRMGPRSSQEIEEDAKILQKNGFKSIGGKDGVAQLLSTRNQQDLQKIFAQYQEITKKNLLTEITAEKALRVSKAGKLKKVLRNLVQCINNPPEYFAKRLRASVKGAGTNDRRLLRILVARSEIDLEAIKEAYQKLYGKPLKKDVDSDTSRKFKKVLDALIDGNVK